jgi:cytochrome c553
MRITWKRAFLGSVALVAFGLVIAWSGIVNIAASNGHWLITDKLLHWAMQMSVRTWAAFTIKEPVADPDGLVSAAGHYASTCAFCHGAPGVSASPVMKAATPSAPNLVDTIGQWSDAQLHWIVKHGVKFTAMPAWPAQRRDDEVRRMTAFVRRLPLMSPAEYRKLAYGSGRLGGVALVSPQDALADCERCHADDGRHQADIPVLAGQRREYLLATLEAFVAGTRASGVMRSAASRLDADSMRALATHYADLPPRLTALKTDTAAIATKTMWSDPDTVSRVRQIVERGLPEAKLPACSKCHGEGKHPRYPMLGGQKAQYMAARLRGWRGDPAIVDSRKPNESMAMIARRIPQEMIEPLALYFEQGSSAGAAARDGRAAVR